jgi:uncharacterized 2Fe-2S/4Fe-4S cluster protein (DUF4445 family)
MADQKPERDSYQIDLEPIGCRIQVEAGHTLLAAAQQAGVQLVSLCGGDGSCGACRVRVASGVVSSPTTVEKSIFSTDELNAGWRLACQTYPEGDVKLDIPQTSLTTTQRLQLEGREPEIPIDPAIISVDLELAPATLDDLRADASRVEGALSQAGIESVLMPLPVLRDLSGRLREWGWRTRVALRHGDVAAFLPINSELMGLAVDIGTTKLAAYLVDLNSGITRAKKGAMNPQVGYGEDVVSRIAYADKHENGRETLQRVLLETIHKLVADLCELAEISPEQIVDAVVVGNTAMHHLFTGLPVHQLGVSPYVPAVARALDLPVGEVGLALAPGASIHLPSNIAGFVGADHVAMLLASGFADSTPHTMAMDIGTNTEISLAIDGRILTCSCASGPAFEGAHIRDGMRAAPGAIERVHVTHDSVRVQTVDGKPASGICGSGVLDAVAEMVRIGVLNHTGRMMETHPHVRHVGGETSFLLVPSASTGHQRDIVLTRQDVAEIQLAKAAIRAGVDVLLEEAGITADAIEVFIIAGAFGMYLDLESAIRIGMLPALPLGRYHQVGNAAGIGAKQMLLSASLRDQAAEMIRRVTYLELTTHPGFTDRYMEAMRF